MNNACFPPVDLLLKQVRASHQCKMRLMSSKSRELGCFLLFLPYSMSHQRPFPVHSDGTIAMAPKLD